MLPVPLPVRFAQRAAAALPLFRMNVQEIASFGPGVGCKWGCKGKGVIPAMRLPSDAWCVVRASMDGTVPGGEWLPVLVTTINVNNKVNKPPSTPRRGERNVKICMRGQNAVHAFFAHLRRFSLRYSGALLHVVPCVVSLIG